MRIALLGPAYPYRGGIAHFTVSLSKALLSQNHEVHIFNFTRQYPSFLFPGKTQLDESDEPLEAPGTRCVDSLNPLSWVLVGRRIRRYSPDLLVVQWWHPFFAPAYGTAARIARRAGIPVVFWCHNVKPHEASPVDSALLRYAYSSADAFVVQASRERELLQALRPNVADERVQVIPHPTYDAFAQHEIPTRREGRLRLAIPQKTPTVLFFGLVRKYKGLDVLLRAIPKMSTQVQVVIAGEFYDDEASYRALAVGYGDRVQFVNRYVPNEDVPAYFSAADVVVLPYRSATQSGIVQLAFALGVPVIVSDVGGISDIVKDGDNGLLVPPNDPEALAQTIDRYFSESLRPVLEEGVKRAQGRFSWAAVATRLEALAAQLKR